MNGSIISKEIRITIIQEKMNNRNNMGPIIDPRGTPRPVAIKRRQIWRKITLILRVHYSRGERENEKHIIE